MFELNDVHKQRIKLAVQASQEGQEVKFRMNPETIVWYRVSRPGTQHVVCNGYGRMEPWLELIEAEFRAQIEGAIIRSSK